LKLNKILQPLKTVNQDLKSMKTTVTDFMKDIKAYTTQNLKIFTKVYFEQRVHHAR